MDILILTAGLACAALGGELFVRGIVGLARWARVSAGIIGATFAAFATSSPELSVAVTSAFAHKPQIALGNVLGSNVINLALILGLAVLIAPIRVDRDRMRRDFSVALLVPVLLGALGYDGVLSRLDGLILLAVFISWLAAVFIEVRQQRNAAGNVLGEARHAWAILFSIGGLVFLIASGMLIVTGAKGVALSYGIDAFVIGATLVAVGTTAPELATTIISRLRGHDEVGMGTLLGSCIFNGLFIIAVAAVIHPIVVSRSEMMVGLTFGLLATIASCPRRSGRLTRERGFGSADVVCRLSWLGAVRQTA